jgi:hypothetical protein
LGQGQVDKQRGHRRTQTLRVGVDEAAHAVFDDRGQFGGGQSHHRQAHRHRLADGKPEARVADRVEEEAEAGKEGTQTGMGNLTQSTQPLGTYTDQIEGETLPGAGEKIGTRTAIRPSPCICRARSKRHPQNGDPRRRCVLGQHRRSSQGCDPASVHET